MEDLIRMIPFKVEFQEPNPNVWIDIRIGDEFSYWHDKSENNTFRKFVIAYRRFIETTGWICVGMRRIKDIDVLILVKNGELLQYASREVCKVVVED